MTRIAGVVALAGLPCLAACGHAAAVSPTPAAPAPAQAPVPKPPDPVDTRIAAADALVEAGLAEVADGHLGEAREAFDRAVDLYLTAPGGAASDPRLARAYRRTIETVHLRELDAFAAGDGFAELPSEAAAIDALGALILGTPGEGARRTAEEAVRHEATDFPVELNDEVLAGIELYQGRLRGWFEEALVRSGRYVPHIRRAFAEAGIPQDLAYVALVESGFKAHALSRARARGVWQFMAETGRRYGLRQDWWLDERNDPLAATRAAAHYLGDLYQRFGDWNLALAAYNAGENRVARGLARYGTRDFWALRRTRALLRETRNYVPLVHAAIIMAKAPELYGFDVELDPPLAFDEVDVRGAVDLRTVAECVAVSLDDVRLLNPQLRRLATPARSEFTLRVPLDSGARLQSCLDGLPAAERARLRTYVVRRGETLSEIAQRHGTTSADLAAANGIGDPRRLGVGRTLVIPAAASARQAASSATGADQVVYTVRPGDTLSTIAVRFRTSVTQLQSWNRLRGSRIEAGRTLSIYAPASF